MIRKSLDVRRLLIPLAFAVALATASCGMRQDDPPADNDQTVTSPGPPRPDPSFAAPDSPPRPPDSTEGEGDRELLYEYCETAPSGDPLCHTSRFGNDLSTADDFLDGADVGPGGLKEMTATDDGFPAGSTIAGVSVPLVNATWTININETIPSEGACEVLMDRAAQMGVVTDLSGTVQAFLILNPVVETHDGVRIGSTLADLQGSLPVEVQEYGAGKIAYTVREDVVSHYDGVEPNRAMLFVLSPDDVVGLWVVGATSYVNGFLSEGLCPAA